MREEWHNIQKQIEKISIKDAALHSIIRDYLVSHAYTDTLAVFDKSYGQRALNPQSAPLGAVLTARSVSTFSGTSLAPSTIKRKVDMLIMP